MSENVSKALYEMRGRSVVIHGQPIEMVLDENSLDVAIETLERQKDEFLTVQSWESRLRLYRGAKMFLQRNMR